MPSRLLLRDDDLLKYRITELAGSLENIHFTDEETATPNHTVSLKWVANIAILGIQEEEVYTSLVLHAGAL